MSERFSHDEMHRILSRASELHDLRERPSADAEGFDLEALVDAAGEMGVPRAEVLEAVALERLGGVPVERRLDRYGGAATVIVERRVPLGADVTLDRLDDWLVHGHHLRREARSGRCCVWRKRTDLAAGLRRELKAFSGGAALGGVSRIEAVVSPLSDGTTVVRLLADRRVDRTIALATEGVFGVGSTLGAVVALFVAPPIALIAAPGLAIAGATVAVTRVGEVKLEREMATLLDRLAAGDVRPSLVRGVARRLGFRT